MQASPEAEIRARIAWRGKITFAEFGEVALYHPRGGYYTGDAPVGPGGDYFTSPSAHPGFAALISVQLRQMWELLGCPSDFYVVEVGAGSGLLARDIVSYPTTAPGAFGRSLRYLALERYLPQGSPRQATDTIQPVVAADIPLRDVVGCFLSNELLDSFPFHRFQIVGRTAKEVYVTLREGQFIEVLDEPSTPALKERLQDLDSPLADGFKGEINLRIAPWMKAVARALRSGFVLTIDYGYEENQLYSPQRAAGTFQTYYNHAQGGSPYQRIGRQDITAHVDFTLVASEGASAGLRTLGLRSQARFLRDMGFDGMLETLQHKSLAERERNANLMAMRELVKPEGLGGFKVLIQERGTAVQHLNQLRPTGGTLDELPVPLLRAEHTPLMEGRYPHAAWETDELWPWGRA